MTTTRRTFLLGTAGAALAATFAKPAFAQARPVTLTVQYAWRAPISR